MNLTRQDAIAQIRKDLDIRTLLTKSKSGLYVCPYCGSGTGSNGTGALKVYETNTFYCHKCNKGGDPLDLLQEVENLDFNGALQEGAKRLCFEIAPYSSRTAPEIDFAAAEAETPAESPKAAEGGIEAQIDYTRYFKAVKLRETDTAAIQYLQSRGIALETAQKVFPFIGFDPAADPANAPGSLDPADPAKKHPCPRLIFPTGRAHYVGRRIDNVNDFSKLNSKGGKPGIFNAAALQSDAEIIFVCEGVFDCLSVLEVGAAAIALNSASNADKFIKALEKNPLKPGKTLALALDADEAGRKAMQTIEAGAQRLNIACIRANLCGGAKDPNEALQQDRNAFLQAVKGVNTARPDSVSSYLENIMAADITAFQEAKNRETGFKNLDLLSDGLYSGLYVVAAISSLGKTTFCAQMADQIAAAGTDCIFFSMEQSRLEMVSKSIARQTALNDIAAAGGKPEFKTAVTSLSIRRGYLPEQVLQAADDYKNSIGDCLSIVEGNFNCDIGFIRDYIRNHIKRTGCKPVVFIDYLQVLQPSADDSRKQKREIIDAAMTELKRLSRELNITILVICSENRSSYLLPTDFESLKESGTIEYTADVVWGLQLQVLNTDIFNNEKGNIKEKRRAIREAKAADPRKIELLCLKNRFGIANFSCYFDYYPKYDLFLFTAATQQRKAASTFKRGVNK